MISKNVVYLVQSYNGFSGSERLAKLREMHRKFPNRSHPYYRGPCDMCGNSDSPVMPHSEDYSRPYRWERPWMYAVCRTCHYHLHMRFRRPWAWSEHTSNIKEIKGIAIRGVSSATSSTKSFCEAEWWEKLSLSE